MWAKLMWYETPDHMPKVGLCRRITHVCILNLDAPLSDPNQADTGGLDRTSVGGNWKTGNGDTEIIVYRRK